MKSRRKEIRVASTLVGEAERRVAAGEFRTVADAILLHVRAGGLGQGRRRGPQGVAKVP